jgi:hypothetical protein
MVDFTQRPRRGSDEKGMNAGPSLHATTHACTRYAQRVLGINVGEAHLHGDSKLRGRCARGIARLLERAHWEARTEDADIWIAGTRALVVKNACVLTVLTGPTKKRLSKKIFRRALASRQAA